MNALERQVEEEGTLSVLLLGMLADDLDGPLGKDKLRKIIILCFFLLHQINYDVSPTAE